jgi:hypothetical protein
MTTLTSPGIAHHSPHRHASSKTVSPAKQFALYTLLPACVSAATVWGLFDIAQIAGDAHPGPSTGTAQQERSVQTVGQVVAVSPASITTRSADGTVTTFAITPDTTQIASEQSTNPVAPAAFMVNDTVTVVGVENNGTAVATALADQNSAAGDGRPMDAA